MKSTDARGESQVSLTGAKMQLELDDISVHYVWDGGDDDDKAQGVELDHVGLVVSMLDDATFSKVHEETEARADHEGKHRSVIEDFDCRHCQGENWQ